MNRTLSGREIGWGGGIYSSHKLGAGGGCRVVFFQDLLIVSARDWSHYFLEIRSILLTMAKTNMPHWIHSCLCRWEQNIGKVKKKKKKNLIFNLLGSLFLDSLGKLVWGLLGHLCCYFSHDFLMDHILSSSSKNSDFSSLNSITFTALSTLSIWLTILESDPRSEFPTFLLIGTRSQKFLSIHYNSWSILPDSRWLLWNSHLDFTVGASDPDSQV